jgi:penicillin-binding protein 2
VFKLIVAAAALQEKKTSVSTTYVCGGGMHVGNRFFKCWETHGSENIYQAIAHSCDVYFYRTGLALGAPMISAYAQMFGFGKPTGIDLPYEVGGMVPSPSWKRETRAAQWFDGDTVNFSIGQGDLLVTPLQMCRAVAVFANKGVLLTPYIVQSVGGRDVAHTRRRATKLNFRPGVLDTVCRGMELVVSDPTGTGSLLGGLPVSIAGKTGTAQVSRGQPHAWFAGYFPVSKPKYVICVFLENGGGGQAACILTRSIVQAMVKEELL